MLVDIGLPGMDGYEVARRVRASPQLSQVELVAVTGYGMEEDRRRARAVGFAHHLTKPVDPAVLRGLIASFVETRPR
jgi:two-component system CheB/CheR fusion protein